MARWFINFHKLALSEITLLKTNRGGIVPSRSVYRLCSRALYRWEKSRSLPTVRASLRMNLINHRAESAPGRITDLKGKIRRGAARTTFRPCRREYESRRVKRGMRRRYHRVREFLHTIRAISKGFRWNDRLFSHKISLSMILKCISTYRKRKCSKENYMKHILYITHARFGRRNLPLRGRIERWSRW